MYSYKNAKYHDEIRKWNTAQLIEALETNGLGDCCAAIQNREVDGETFLNLTEGQLSFWRNTLSNVQIKRLWSYIQLAKEKPQDFITIPQSTPTETPNTRKIEKLKSPIVQSLNNIFGQQQAPIVSQQPEQESKIPESNYPKLMPPLNSNNDFQQVPSRPGVLPPKPPHLSRRPVPQPMPEVNKPQDSISQHHEEEFYEEEPTSQSQNDFQPPLNSSYLFKQPSLNSLPIRREVPQDSFSRPPAVTPYRKPPGVPQHHEDLIAQPQKSQNGFQASVKPSNFSRRPVPPPVPVVNKPQDSISRPRHGTSYPKPPIVTQHHDEEEFSEEQLTAEPQKSQNNFQAPLPPGNSSYLFKKPPSNSLSISKEIPGANKPQNSFSRPPVADPPPPVSSYPKPPVVPQYHEEEDFYEEEPMTQPQKSENDSRPPVNSSSLFRMPPTNPIPIRKEVPLSVHYGRPLPSPPKDEEPFPLPPNTVPIVRNLRSPQPTNLPRPPISFLPPPNVPNFHESDDEEQAEYDIIAESKTPEYRRQSWFKDIDRDDAKIFLKGRPNGTFIARPSKQPEYECTFSVICESKIYNLPVIKDNGKVILGKNSFNTVSEIVERFQTNPLVLNGLNNEDLFVTLRKF